MLYWVDVLWSGLVLLAVLDRLMPGLWFPIALWGARYGRLSRLM